MEDCKDAPYSEEYYDLLVSYLSLENEYLPGGCIQNIDKDFNVVYLQSAGLPKLDIDQYTYSAIPKCFTTLDEEALQAGGIIRGTESAKSCFERAGCSDWICGYRN